MEHDKYLVHDVYHVVFNLCMISEKVLQSDIIRYTVESGKKDGRTYEAEDIVDTLRYLVANGKISEKNGEYKVRT